MRWAKSFLYLDVQDLSNMSTCNLANVVKTWTPPVKLTLRVLVRYISVLVVLRVCKLLHPPYERYPLTVHVLTNDREFNRFVRRRNTRPRGRLKLRELSEWNKSSMMIKQRWREEIKPGDRFCNEEKIILSVCAIQSEWRIRRDGESDCWRWDEVEGRHEEIALSFSLSLTHVSNRSDGSAAIRRNAVSHVGPGGNLIPEKIPLKTLILSTLLQRHAEWKPRTALAALEVDFPSWRICQYVARH